MVIVVIDWGPNILKPGFQFSTKRAELNSYLCNLVYSFKFLDKTAVGNVSPTHIAAI